MQPIERWAKDQAILAALERCPECGATQVQHEANQAVANEIRAQFGLVPLDPPDIRTGHQRRGAL